MAFSFEGLRAHHGGDNVQSLLLRLIEIDRVALIMVDCRVH